MITNHSKYKNKKRLFRLFVLSINELDEIILVYVCYSEWWYGWEPPSVQLFRDIQFVILSPGGVDGRQEGLWALRPQWCVFQQQRSLGELIQCCTTVTGWAYNVLQRLLGELTMLYNGYWVSLQCCTTITGWAYTMLYNDYWVSLQCCTMVTGWAYNVLQWSLDELTMLYRVTSYLLIQLLCNIYLLNLRWVRTKLLCNVSLAVGEHRAMWAHLSLHSIRNCIWPGPKVLQHFLV